MENELIKVYQIRTTLTTETNLLNDKLKGRKLNK